MIRTLRIALCACLLLSFATLAGKPPAVWIKEQSPKPEDGKALFVIMRPDAIRGGNPTASVYDVTDTETKFIGLISEHQKFAVQVTPGHHRFMVVAENADFVEADVVAGKTYYTFLRMRQGIMQSRFSLLPLLPDPNAGYSLESKQTKGWLADSYFVETNEVGQAWYAKHKDRIEEKRADYMKKWNVMAPADKAELTLRPEDGV